jgi:hypothetical protein
VKDIGAFSSGAVAEGAALGVTLTRIVAHCVARSARDLVQAVEQRAGGNASRSPRPQPSGVIAVPLGMVQIRFIFVS